MNDQDDQGVKQEEVQPQEESPTPEKTSEEVEEPKEEVATESEGTEAETADEPKKGANARIRELNQQKKEAEERALKAEKSLAQHMADITNPVGFPGGQTPDIEPQVEPGQEITPEQYKQDLIKTASALTQVQIAQNNAANRINNESLEAVRTYPELDPESEHFDKELSDTVTEATEAYVRNNPYSAQVKKFVDRLMKPYKGAVAKEVGKATENIAKQVSGAALRPTSIRKDEKSAKEKSIAELEQELGIVQT